MPGLPTRLVIAEQVLQQLGQPAQYHGVTIDHSWFMFGAIGPAIGDFLPAGPYASGNQTTNSNPYLQLWQQVLAMSIGTQDKPGLIPTIRSLQDLLSLVQARVAFRDFEGLMALNPSNLTTYIQNLTDAITTFQDINQLRPLGILMGTAPLINNTQFRVDPEGWSGREWLHWKRTGDFSTALLESAVASGDARFISYALGWQVTYSSLVCGSDFVNSIVGSAYRTYWWRYRWTSNFVDAWVWGFYKTNPRPTFGDDGNPVFANPAVAGGTDYGSWPSLCNAALHRWIDVTDGALDGFAAAQAVVKNINPNGAVSPLITSNGTPGLLPPPLPGDFTDFWIQTWQNTYAADLSAGSTPIFTQQGLQLGYLMNWLVLWFQTSGQVIGCLPQTSPSAPSSSCFDSQYASAQQSSMPGQGSPETLKPTPQQKTDVGQVACSALLALIGLVFEGGFGDFSAAAVIEAASGIKQLNWDQLECQLYWVGQFMYNGLSILHNVTVLTGLQHPYSYDLDKGSALQIMFGIFAVEGDTGAAQTCQSRLLSAMLQPWIPSGADISSSLFGDAPSGIKSPSWTVYPQDGTPEPPLPQGPPPWTSAGRWPSAFVDDESINPPSASILLAPPFFDAGINAVGAPASFGPAVQSALKIIAAAPTQLPNWNLDGDRSLGWLTWALTGPYVVPVTNIKAED